MAQRVAAAGKQVGMSEADILGLSAALSSMGIEAESGGTNISKIMSQIDKDIATGSKSIETWAAAAGMSADQFAAKWKQAPVEALEALFTGMGNAVEEGGNMSVMLEDLGIKSSQAVDVSKRLASGHDVLSKAIQTANTAWRENTALTEEVANKNDSLSAKFQMLQNRATAILEKIGKPTADALLDIFDAAQPVFDLIEDGVTAFADLDKGTQQTIVQLVALAAAAGPVNSAMGRVLDIAGGLINTAGTGATVIETFARYMKDGGSASESFAKALAESTTPAMADAAKHADMVANKTASIEQAMGNLSKGAVIALVVTLIARLTSQLADYVAHEQEFERATSGLHSAIENLGQAGYSATDGVENMGRSLSEIRDASRDLNKSQADIAESLRQVSSGTDENTMKLNQYMSTIEELSGKSSLNAGEQERLQKAVDGLNSILGTSVSVINAQTGQLNTNYDALLKVADAYRKYAEVQATMDAYTKVQEQIIENQIEMDRLQNELNKADKGVGWYIGDFAVFSDFGGVADKYHELEKSMQQAKDRSGELSFAQGELKKMLDNASISGDQYKAVLNAMGLAEDDASDSAKNMGNAATEAGNAMREAARQAAEEQRRANEQIIADQQAANEARLREQQAANEQAIKDQQKANERANKQQQKANEQANKQLQKQLDAKYKTISKQLAAEEDAIRKSNDARLAQQRKANEQQESALKKSLDARIASIKKSLDAEIAAKRKANTKTLKEAKDAQAAETKAYKAETSARIAEMDRELKAKLKQIEDASGAAAIDARIKELQGESDAEDRALKQREQQEKVAELRMAVEKAKSRRKRAEAEKDLNEYLAQIQHEQREQERKDEIDRLNEQKSNIAEQTQAKKDALTEQYEQQKSQYEQQRAEQLEREDKQREDDYERLSEFLSTQLDKRREAADAIIEQEREKVDQQIEVMREQHQQQQDTLKEMLDRELEARREAHSERLEQIKEQHSEIMESQREQQQEQLEQQREAQQAELDQMRAAQQAEIEQMRATQAQELQELRNNLDAEVQAIISGGEQMAAAAGAAAQQTAQNMAAGIAQMPPKTGETAKLTARNFLDVINQMPWETKKTADTTGHTLVERLNAHVMPTTDAGKALRNAALRNIEGLPEEGRQKGEGFGSGLSGGIGSKESETSSSANRLKNAAENPLMDLAARSGGFGSKTGNDYAGGIGQGGSRATSEAQSIASGVSSSLSSPANNSRTWGADTSYNYFEGLKSWANLIWEQATNIAQGVANILGHSTPKEGPMVGDDMWFVHLGQNLEGGLKKTAPGILGAADDLAQGITDAIANVDAAKTLRDRMRAQENELALQTQRWARVMEDNFTPDLTARYDANINYAKRGAITSTAAAFGTVAGPNITMNLHLDNVRIDSSMDIHRTAKDLAVEVVREVEASLAIA